MFYCICKGNSNRLLLYMWNIDLKMLPKPKKIKYGELQTKFCKSSLFFDKLSINVSLPQRLSNDLISSKWRVLNRRKLPFLHKIWIIHADELIRMAFPFDNWSNGKKLRSFELSKLPTFVLQWQYGTLEEDMVPLSPLGGHISYSIAST